MVAEEPVLDSAEPVAPQTDADEDFEALLEQAQVQTEPQSLDDLADFDLDIGEAQSPEPAPVETEEAPVDVAAELAAFDEIPEFDPISELELPEDFDLSLSLDDESPAAKSFASELDDVNAELDKLSQSLESPSLEPHFTAEDAARELDPLDDRTSTSSPALTKWRPSWILLALTSTWATTKARETSSTKWSRMVMTTSAEAEEMLSRLV